MLAASLKTFAAIVDTGSLAGAAKQLHLSPSAVSKQLSALEQRLGTQLIRRTTRSLEVTDAGERFFKRCVEITQSIDAAETEVRDLVGKPAGTLKVTMPQVLACSDIARVMRDYTDANPQISVDIEVTNNMQSLIDKNLDIGFRVGDLPDSSLIGSHLFDAKVVMCATQDYLARNGVPNTVKQLSRHRLLIPSPVYLSASAGEAAASPTVIRPARQTVCDNIPLLIALAKSSAGIAMLWDYSVAAEIEDGGLQVLSCPIPHAPRAVSMVYHSREYVPARVRLFIEHVRGHFFR